MMRSHLGVPPEGRGAAGRALLAFLLAAWATNALAADFSSCLRELHREAVANGITPQVFDTAMAGVEPDQSVLDAMDSQPEFVTPIWDYMAGLVDEQRIADGRAKLAEWAAVLAEAEQRFGVDRHVLLAVWGVETDYGKVRGGRPLVRSLATVSCFGERQRFFRGEFVAALHIIQDGDIRPEVLVGSWAGAFGQTQFMPSSFQRFAVDFDGDGRRDIVGSVADALGSTANYLKRVGWVSGESWGYEVRLPPDYRGPSGRRSRQALAQWRRLGVKRVNGAALSGGGPAALLLPAGAGGPAFMVFKNFDAIHAYNAAESYVLAIAHLSDRLRGAGPFQTAWPTDDPGLSRAERREVQQRLLERGFDVGVVDGAIGPRTRAAIEAFQTSVGLPVDGRAGARVLKALKDAATPR
ncbi:MAG: lytic murein transglycosylase [Betaproteobacteria bacterium]|nr:lytic murein transglycosylase [Betaproteobacteria bacterium]